MSLTVTAVRNAKPANKTRRLYDERGLYLEISPSGGKWWRFKYRFDDKEKRLSLGTFPDVSLSDARERRDAARKKVANGVDPSEHRKAKKAARKSKQENTFEVVAREWHARQSSKWSPQHAEKVLRRMEQNLFPWLGNEPVASIKAPDLLSTLRRIEGRGLNETVHRALSDSSRVFRYAIVTGRADYNPATDLRGALEPLKKTNHLAAVTEPAEVARLLRTLAGYEGSVIIQSALRLAPLVFVRPGELRQARWEDIDLEAAEWRYLVTKTNTQHVVPLSKQAVSILEELYPVTGRGQYVFPNARSPRGDRPMSDNAILVALRTLGIGKDEMTGHGFRAMARTILDEVLGFRPDFIEHQLAHAVRDPNGRAYNRTAHLTERKKMMQEWADYLDKLEVGAEIIPINQRA
jgi:integrase